MSRLSGLTPYARRVGYVRCYWRTFYRQLLKRVFRRDIQLKLPTGLSLYLPKESHYASVVWLTNALADEGCEDIFVSLAEADAVFFDVGAHLGYYSLWCSPKVKVVHAFEPDPRNQGWLAKNASLASNVHVHAVAVSDRTGVIRLSQHSSSAQTHVASEEEIESGSAKIVEIPAVTLDQHWRDHGTPPVGLIKVDVEGHECAVVLGAKELTSSARPIWLVETTLENYARLRDHLRALDYVAFAAVPAKTGVSLVSMDDVANTPQSFSMAFFSPRERIQALLDAARRPINRR